MMASPPTSQNWKKTLVHRFGELPLMQQLYDISWQMRYVYVA
jgi:hypothetical protein